MKKAIFAVLGLAAVLSLLMASVGCASPDAGSSLDAVAFGSTGISVGDQVGKLTAGTSGSVTYSITVTGSGGGWTGLFTEGLPSGTSAAFDPSGLDEPWPAYSTLTISYDGTTAAGTYDFCVGESPSGKPPAQHQFCTDLTIEGGCPDADQDGVCDDDDNCPDVYNPNQEDQDGDDVGDACDNCPSDPNKTEPGICGCGTPDVDTDNDGTLDCNDACPYDPDKTDPGICGCGVPDADSDGDGQADCVDLCPNDPAKTAPGACGCGVADTDSDGDGTPDCIDGCPSDPDKIAPGICGCDVPDTDTDGDGIPDCVDPTPGGQQIVRQPKTWYVLRTSSTEGGEVTRPRWGIAPYLAYYRKAYYAGEVVNLEATPDDGYRFVNWTGDVDTIADVNAASTTIIMNGFYEIKANFELET